MRAVVLHVHRCALCGHECGYAVSQAMETRLRAGMWQGAVVRGAGCGVCRTGCSRMLSMRGYRWMQRGRWNGRCCIMLTFAGRTRLGCSCGVREARRPTFRKTLAHSSLRACGCSSANWGVAEGASRSQRWVGRWPAESRERRCCS